VFGERGKVAIALRELVERRRRNWAFLRAVANAIGAEYEAMSYEQLRQPAEVLSTERVIEGVRVSFSAEAYNRKRTGDLCVSVDVDAALPTFLGVKPSYHFFKRPDGSVYY
jgi:hypothetical protein